MYARAIPGLLLGLIGLVLFLNSGESDDPTAGEHPAPDPALAESMSAGKEIYTATCSACHQPHGNGLSPLFPPLARADYLLEDIDRAISGIIYGIKGPITVNGEPYDMIMAPGNLSDEDIADVMTYILNSWGNTAGGIRSNRVAEVRHAGPRPNAVLTAFTDQ